MTSVAPKAIPVPGDWIPGQWTGEDSGDSEDECHPVPGGEENDSLMFEYNETMSSLSEKVNKVGKFIPLTFHLDIGRKQHRRKRKFALIKPWKDARSYAK